MKNNFFSIHPEFCGWERSDIGFDDVVLSKEVKDGILESVSGLRRCRRNVHTKKFRRSVTGLMPVLLFEGMPGTGKSITAKALAKELGLPVARLYHLDCLNHEPSHGISLAKLIQDLNRKECLIVIDDFDKYLDRQEGFNAADLLVALESTRNPVILTVNNGHFWGDYYPVNRRITRRFLFPIPSAVERKKIWKMHLPKGSSFASEKDLEQATKYFLLAGGSIKNIIFSVLMGSGNVKRIKYEMLLPYLTEELEKITGYLSGVVRIFSGQCGRIAPEIIKQFEPIRQIVQRQEVLSSELPAAMAVGIISEMDVQTIAFNMAHVIDKPIVLRTFGDDEFYEREEKELSNIIVRSLPKSEFQVLYQVNETDMGIFFNKRLALDPINFLLINNPTFDTIHPRLQFCVRIKKMDIDDANRDLAGQLQEFSDFNVREACPESKRPAFLRFLRFIWIMEGGRRLGHTDAERALDGIGKNGHGRQMPLFGTITPLVDHDESNVKEEVS